MKLLTSLMIALTLTACGSSDQMSDEQKTLTAGIPETAEGIPDFRGWQIMNGATDSCFQVDPGNVHCMTEFEMPAGEKQCSDATIKFIVKKDGYMYVQTLRHVVIRQGELHRIEFTVEPEIFNITDETADEKFHVLRCYGSDGEIVRL
jgi:hypothetical protein